MSSERTTSPLDISIIVEARRRGVPLRTLAAQLDCSYQAVASRIKYYERRTGDTVTVHAKPPHRGRVASVCKWCGRTKWCPPHLVTKFCSRHCFHDSTRTLSHDDIMRAIEVRQSGSTWTGVGKLFNMSQQAIQGRIWRHLRATGLLSRANVNRIWRPATHLFRREPSWRWLANKFGEPR